MPPVADDAVCLRHYDWSETSQTVVLLTRAHGLVRALAKGARRARSSFSGGVELLARAEIQLYPRTDKDLDLLGTWDLTDPHLHLRRSLPALNAGLYAADITAHLLDTHDPHPATFDALVNTLSHLGDAEQVAHLVLAFQRDLLNDTGLTPRLDGPLPDAPAVGFDPDEGTLVPDPGPPPPPARAPTVPADPLDPGPAPWRVRTETVLAIREPESADAATAARGAKLLNAWIATRIGRMPTSAGPFFRAI